MGISLNLKARLLEDTLESTGRQVIRRLACHRYTPCFMRVPKLPMTTAANNLFPTIILQHSHDCSHFHSSRVA
jgi:hypothetical protein